MANQCGRAPRWQRRLGYLSAGVRFTSRERPNFGTRRRPGRGFSDLYSVAFLHSNGTETKRNKEVGQRCYFETVGSVFASPESTPSTEKNRHRRGHCAGGAFREHWHGVFPRGLTRAGGRKATFANQLRGVDALAESPWPLSRKQPTENLHYALPRQCRLG